MVLSQRRVDLDSKKKFFTVMVVSHQNRLAREVVGTPTLELFETGWGSESSEKCPCSWQGG